MFLFRTHKHARTAILLFLLCCILLTGGCISISANPDASTEATKTDADGASQADAGDTTLYLPTVPPPTRPDPDRTTQAPTEEATTEAFPEELLIDWDTMTSTTLDPNVLTEEEMEEMAEQNPQMADLMELIGPYVDFFGFAYDAEQDIFYSTKYPIQRIFGYNTLYDTGASRFGMYFQTKRIRFDYMDKEWMVQIWKGQYGVTVGGEVGVYYRDKNKFVKHFEAVSDDDLVMMGFRMNKNDKPYLQRGPEKHWWLTGFRILDVAVPTQLSMTVFFDWEDVLMANAFEQGLREVLLSDIQYKRDDTQFWLTWTL